MVPAEATGANRVRRADVPPDENLILHRSFQGEREPLQQRVKGPFVFDLIGRHAGLRVEVNGRGGDDAEEIGWVP